MSGRVLVGVKRVIDYAVKVISIYYFHVHFCTFFMTVTYMTLCVLLAHVSLTPPGCVTNVT